MRRRTVLTVAGVAVTALLLPWRATAMTTTTPVVLFVAAHPDDEIWEGVSIVEHVAAGLDVHALLLTDGGASGVVDQLNGDVINSWWGVRHDPAAEGYAPLTVEDLAAARVREFTNSVRCMASGLGTVTIHRAQLPDGQVTELAAQAAITAVADAINPSGPVRLKGHTWRSSLDGHPDHIAAGTAMHNLKTIDPIRFGDVRYYVVPGSWSSTSGCFWDNPSDATVADRVRNATRAYGAWAPASGSYAIGYHSKKDWLDVVAANPRCLIHS